MLLIEGKNVKSEKYENIFVLKLGAFNYYGNFHKGGILNSKNKKSKKK